MRNLSYFYPSFHWWFLYYTALLPIRFFFGVVIPPVLQYVWHNGSFLHLAQDDSPVYEGCRLVGFRLQYGSLKRETMDVIIPDPSRRNLGGKGESLFDWTVALLWTLFDLVTCYPRAILAWAFTWFAFDNSQVHRARDFPAICFVHGGGYAAIDPEIQHHQCTAFARKGFAVYMIGYPWAPEDPHPQQLISAMRALAWVKKHHAHSTVSLVGESAGGNLVTMMSALLCNPCALRAFCRRYAQFATELTSLDFPTISSTTSWYGILDQSSWKKKGFLSWGLEFTQTCHGFQNPDCVFLTLVDVCEEGLVSQFPHTLLVAGQTDPLGLLHSSQRADTVLLKYCPDTIVEYAEYHAGHAFIGLNPFILVFLHGRKWRELALKATLQTVEFISRHDMQEMK